MNERQLRVVVLGHSGEAQQQLCNALDELGAKTLAVGDFGQLDPAQMREQQPDAWLVSIDENTDAALLDPWQPLFDDPNATVLFDDADVTRRLSGWDLARWARHLAAKVFGRDDVLPPVRADAERLPQPGALHEAAINHDGGGSASYGMEAHAMSIASPTLAADHSVVVEAPAAAELSLTDDADFAALSASFEAERVHREASAAEHAPAMALDDLLRVQSSGGEPAGGGFAKSSGDGPSASPALPAGLSLLDMGADHGSPPPRATAQSAPELRFDVSHFELQPLEDTSEKSSESPNGGLIAIIAGLGGPDAVRQLLGALPAGLKIPVLLWQHLDAGKHDRLAQQLAKATKLPVYLAKSGDLARLGAIGVMGDGMGLRADSGWWFVDGCASATQGVTPALNDPATVVAILSGAEAAIVGPALQHSVHGGKVLVQTPMTCFDGTAASALFGEGAIAASPAEVATLAAARWGS